ncbi:hypothetical protein [Pimelobacter sp. 30-1]|uniref:hypothetical protein n=1 Tax=Pimelobacter sp. 30-1 TaxID=2004991 RepID=UPI001C04FB4F|nr:hypothetical protein [Pimelobacter sp. 30-1]MBU2698743.1 hypothetical protein [Pimelobacter sp. 30-1]
MDSYLDARIAKLEEHVNWLYAQAGHPPPYTAPSAGAAGHAVPGPLRPSEEVLAFIRADRVVHAVKQYRRETGDGLREANRAVESFVAEYRAGRLR